MRVLAAMSREERWCYLALRAADGAYRPLLPFPMRWRRLIAMRMLARRMPGHE